MKRTYTEGEEKGEGKNLSRRRRRSEKLNIRREGNGKNLNTRRMKWNQLEYIRRRRWKELE